MAQCSATTKKGPRCSRRATDHDRCGQHRMLGLAPVAASGDRRATLMELRQILARAIDAGPAPRDLAALSRRLEVVVTTLATMVGSSPSEETSTSDDLAHRRAARLAGATTTGG